MKSMRFLVSHSLFKCWKRQCRGDHLYIPLQGFIRDARGRKVFATKLAHVYPDRLCNAVANSIFQLVKGELPQFEISFALKDASSDRKRPVGSQRTWLEHRQHQAACLVAASGYQLKQWCSQTAVADRVRTWIGYQMGIAGRAPIHSAA